MRKEFETMLDTLPKDEGKQKEDHRRALVFPREGFELAIYRMVEGWLTYADAHQERYEDGIGGDFVLGKTWEVMGDSLLAMLNGETGRLDCGTLNTTIREAMTKAGFPRP